MDRLGAFPHILQQKMTDSEEVESTRRAITASSSLKKTIQPKSAPEIQLSERSVQKLTPNQINNKLSEVEISEDFLKCSMFYAQHLLDQYPENTHTLLTLGQQCVITNAFLELLLTENEFDHRVHTRPVHQLFDMSKLDTEKINSILSKLFPTKEELGNKTLVISRNLEYMLTMDELLPYIEAYLNSQNIPHTFDFTVSQEAADEDPETFENLMDNPKVHLSVLQKRLQRLTALDYKTIKTLDLDKHIATTPDTIAVSNTNALWATNENHHHLLHFLASNLKGTEP